MMYDTLKSKGVFLIKIEIFTWFIHNYRNVIQTVGLIPPVKLEGRHITFTVPAGRETQPRIPPSHPLFIFQFLSF
jgi:hypothetical protein